MNQLDSSRVVESKRNSKITSAAKIAIVSILTSSLEAGIKRHTAVNEERCRQLIDQSLMMVTSIAPKIGYEKAAAFAKEAFDSGKFPLAAKLFNEMMTNEKFDEFLTLVAYNHI